MRLTRMMASSSILALVATAGLAAAPVQAKSVSVDTFYDRMGVAAEQWQDRAEGRSLTTTFRLRGPLGVRSTNIMTINPDGSMKATFLPPFVDTKRSVRCIDASTCWTTTADDRQWHRLAPDAVTIAGEQLPGVNKPKDPAPGTVTALITGKVYQLDDSADDQKASLRVTDRKNSWRAVLRSTGLQGQEQNYVSSKVRMNPKPAKIRKPALGQIGDPDSQTTITFNQYTGAMEIDLGTIN